MPTDARLAVVWESAVLHDGGHTYIYGTESAPGRMTFAHVAREAADGARRYWTGSGWSADPGASARLLSGVGAAYAVRRMDPVHLLVTRENDEAVAYMALSPAGPFDGPHYLGAMPQAVTVDGEPGRLVVSDAGRFEGGWPLWPRATTPAPPAVLTVTAADDHADLRWRSVPRSTAYRVYLTDVTAGQTHFTRYPVAFHSNKSRIWHLIPGHRYEFRVVTVAGLSEGPLGEVVVATPHSTRPAADVIRLAGTPEAVDGVYMMSLRPGTVRPENLEHFLRQLVAQHGGTFRCLLTTIGGCSFSMTEDQARDLAAHPEVDTIEQDTEAEVD